MKKGILFLLVSILLLLSVSCFLSPTDKDNDDLYDGGASGPSKEVLYAQDIAFFNKTVPLSYADSGYMGNMHGYNWMKYINGRQELPYLSYPGSHDSCTSYIPPLRLISNRYACTQTLSLMEQFVMGCRVFDLRMDEDLDMYHGIISLGVDLEDAIRELLACVKTYDSEAVFVILSNERGDRDEYFENLKNFFLGTIPRIVEEMFGDKYRVSDCFTNMSYIGRLEYVRGKIVFLYRDDIEKSIGFVNEDERSAFRQYGAFRPYIDFPGTIGMTSARDYGGGYLNYYIQDYSSNVLPGTKQEYIYECLKKSTSSYNIINHTSGFKYHSGPFMSYPECAKDSNPYLNRFIRSSGIKGHLGYVMMDFFGINDYGGTNVSGSRLATAVWQQNFYQEYTEYYWEESLDSLRSAYKNINNTYENGLQDDDDSSMDGDPYDSSFEGIAISSIDELNEFIDRVNAGESDLNAQLTANISTAVTKHMNNYSGIFDGKKHYITLDLSTETDAIGLFGKLSGEVKNLKITGSVLGDQKVGGICSELEESGSVTNCIAYNLTVRGASDVGGFCGVNNKGSLTGNSFGKKNNDQKSMVRVKAEKRSGGICGSSNGGSIVDSVYHCSYIIQSEEDTGGVCGYAKDTILENNVPDDWMGDVNHRAYIGGWENAGGICGRFEGNGHIKNCASVADVGEYIYLGGICGYDTSTGGISDCIYYGKVTGNISIDVFVGKSDKTPVNCTSYGKVIYY